MPEVRNLGLCERKKPMRRISSCAKGKKQRALQIFMVEAHLSSCSIQGRTTLIES